MAWATIANEGGLFSTDLLDRLGASPAELDGQRPEEFGIGGARPSDEIQSAFSDMGAFWNAFERRRAHTQQSLTTLTRESWIIPLLDRLGYVLTFQRAAAQAGGTSFQISHRATDGENGDEHAPPVHIVGLDVDLDRRGDGRQSPHATVQDYLNRSDTLWGLVTNGRKLRLLRDSARIAKPTYLEFDLEAMLAGNQYNEFVLLYRLLHRTRLPQGAADAHDCLLEKYYQKSADEGSRVREKLRDGVERALGLLGSGGFLSGGETSAALRAFADSRLGESGYFRQLLRLIYRLLFLMVAEERRLLLVSHHANADKHKLYNQWYAIARLRDRADRRRAGDGDTDLWEGLKQTFRLFRESRTADTLGLTALDGELFAAPACAELELSTLRNDTLLEAIWHLSTFEEVEGRRRTGVRRRVNYAGLDVEELGSVYESLLDFHPRVDAEAGRFALIAGSERKTTGSYYTPPALVGELIKSALEPVIEARLAAADTVEAKEAALLDLKVCDPAAGSGHFLLAAARRIGRELAVVRPDVEGQSGAHKYRAAVRDAIRHCVYAVDRNPLAVDLCKVALWLEGHAAGLPLSFLDHHVKNGDSLVGVFDLAVLAAGIPDDAYKALTGDHKTIARDLRNRNKAEREGQRPFDFEGGRAATPGDLADDFAALANLAESSPDDIQTKARRYAELRNGAAWQRLKHACDAWTATFFAPLASETERRVPTTETVRRVLAAQEPWQGQRAAMVDELADVHSFFHWPLEFPDVVAQGGFDVVLGNPPWDVSQFLEEEYFKVQEPSIAALSGAKRKKAIACLESTSPGLWQQYRSAKREYEASNLFLRAGGRFPLTAFGKLNSYSLFAETFLRLLSPEARAGVIVPTGIATDDSNKAFFDEVAKQRRLASLFDFENRERLFPAVDTRQKFCLLTLGTDAPKTSFTFFATRTEQLADDRRRFTLTPQDIELINPNTRTCPVFRSQIDAELTKKIYSRVPVLINERKGDGGNSWRITFRQGLFNMTSDSGLFRTFSEMSQAGATHEGMAWRDQGGKLWLPLYEGKMIHHYDHRWATYEGHGGHWRDVRAGEKRNETYQPMPRYWVAEGAVEARLKEKGWNRKWLLGWRDITNATNERTVISAAFPRVGCGDTLLLMFPSVEDPRLFAALAGSLNSLAGDYVARQKVGGTHLKYVTFKQLAVLPPDAYGEIELSFILSRVLELTYTAEDMRPFAQDLGYDGPPFPWDPERRAVLRAQLDAYYAYLYGLIRDELRYILDPADVFGEDFPSETFRVLKNNEIKKFGEYRVRRLVLESWDRFAEDGTFAPDRLAEAEASCVITPLMAAGGTPAPAAPPIDLAQIAALRAQIAEQTRPTLYVEGSTDVAILRAAWEVFYPGEALPVDMRPAGGTTQMGSLAGKGRALRDVLGGRLVCALADNDRDGRALVEDGHVRKGGRWKQLPNGVHWCLLEPTAEFASAMERFGVPKDYRPFTVEACFPAELRRQAMAEGAYGFFGETQAELTENAELARRIIAALPTLSPNDDAYFYLMAPSAEAKEPFAGWITAPDRRTPENYAAFEPIVSGLRQLLEQEPAPRSRRARTTRAADDSSDLFVADEDTAA